MRLNVVLVVDVLMYWQCAVPHSALIEEQVREESLRLPLMRTYVRRSEVSRTDATNSLNIDSRAG